MTAQDVLDRMKKNFGAEYSDPPGRDTFKAGGPDTEVKGIATTFMATLDLLQRAQAAGLNMVITHETTYWNDKDTVTDLVNDPTYKFKLDFCTKNNMVIMRFHDHAHSHRPDFISQGFPRVMGWTQYSTNPGLRSFKLPETTLGELAADIQRKTKSRAFRVVGDPKAKVSTIGLGMGYGIPQIRPDLDVVIGGENPETGGTLDPAEYVLDAAYLGRNKGLIVLGHEISEEPGMQEVADWLKGFITEIPVQFVRAGEPYWSPKVG